jgi:hypothetical protein
MLNYLSLGSGLVRKIGILTILPKIQRDFKKSSIVYKFNNLLPRYGTFLTPYFFQWPQKCLGSRIQIRN